MKIYAFANFSEEMSKVNGKFIAPKQIARFLEIEQQNIVS